MNIVKQPPAIHTAFNPVMLHIEDSNETVTIDIVISGKVISRERDTFNDLAMFDLSKIANKFFRNHQDYIHPLIFLDYNLFVGYNVNANSQILSFTAINAVAQIGESSDLTTQKGTFLTKLERLKKYDGYDLSISILGFNNDTLVSIDNNQIYGGSILHSTINISDGVGAVSILNGGSIVNLQDANSENITDTSGEVITVRDIPSGEVVQRTKYVSNECTPDSPFYVRWINQQGGWDYWMFSYRQIHNIDIDNALFFKPTIFDQEAANGVTQLIRQEGVHKITVGASGLNDNEYDCVSKIIYSPIKEWYDKSLNRWFTLQVDDGENNKDTRIKAQSVEFTFILPDIQLQF